jgi:MoxR-like ATPases
MAGPSPDPGGAARSAGPPAAPDQPTGARSDRPSGAPSADGRPTDVADVRDGLARAGYLADDGLATALFLAVRMGQPLLLEGEPGVGKTEAAKALAALLDTVLVRLQCYEGLTAAEALYEWNYPRQLLAIRLAESRGASLAEADLFGPDYLLPRPLLAAIDHPGPRPAVLLIDEVDRADDEFEAFLFEMLAEGAVTIPELGTRTATVRPVAILTSNRTRDLHDALRRRCLYHYITYPDRERVAEIIRLRVPEASATLAERVATSVQRLRDLTLAKAPGVAEAIAWAAALQALGISTWDSAAAERTLGAVLKYDEDLATARAAGLPTILGA